MVYLHDMPSEQVDGMSVEAVHEAFQGAAKHPGLVMVLTISKFKPIGIGHSVSDPANTEARKIGDQRDGSVVWLKIK